MAIYRYKALLQAKAAFEAGLWVRGCAILTALNSVGFALFMAPSQSKVWETVSSQFEEVKHLVQIELYKEAEELLVVIIEDFSKVKDEKHPDPNWWLNGPGPLVPSELTLDSAGKLGAAATLQLIVYLSIFQSNPLDWDNPVSGRTMLVKYLAWAMKEISEASQSGDTKTSTALKDQLFQDFPPLGVMKGEIIQGELLWEIKTLTQDPAETAYGTVIASSSK